MRQWMLLNLLLISCLVNGQVAGGNTVYNFLKLPASPLPTALGGENISVISNDVTMGYQSPALLRKEMNGQAGFVFTGLPGSIKTLHLTGNIYKASWAT